MKKLFGIIIAIMMVFALVACGEKANENNKPQQNAPAENTNTGSQPTETATPVENNTPANNTQGGVTANNGTITLSKADVAIVVNGTSVKMPYNLKELEAAGVPADESRAQIELKAGDMFSANLYLDENEDYLLIPAYQNKGEASVKITEAEAEEITMTSYASSPADQGVSILGVTFGMTKSDLKARLGEPSLDEDNQLEWHVEVPDMAYEGTLSINVAGDGDDAVVSQVRLSVVAK